MIRLIGPPPQRLLEKADPEVYSRLYDEHGERHHPSIEVLHR